MAIIYGRAIGGVKVATMSLFGNGSDGDLVLTSSASQLATLARITPETKQYKSMSIASGATYTASGDCVLRVQGDCTIDGVIDLSATQPSYSGGNLSLFVGGDLTINGGIHCDGADGENMTNGGNGGSVYIVHNGALHNNGQITVNGGLPDGNGNAGKIGTITILSYDEYMQGQTA